MPVKIIIAAVALSLVFSGVAIGNPGLSMVNNGTQQTIDDLRRAQAAAAAKIVAAARRGEIYHCQGSECKIPTEKKVKEMEKREGKRP